MISIPSGRDWVARVWRFGVVPTGSRPTNRGTTLADGFDLLLLFMEAGLPLAPAFKYSASILVRRRTDLAKAMETTARELEEDGDRNAVLLRFGSRQGTQEEQAIVASFALELRYGTPPIKALRDLVKTLFATRIEEIDRHSSFGWAPAAVPLVLFSVPCILFLAWHFLIV
jgi:hypothetical protein